MLPTRHSKVRGWYWRLLSTPLRLKPLYYYDYLSSTLQHWIYYETLHLNIGSITSKDKRYLQTSAEGLIEHEPRLKCRDKWEPRKKSNGKEYDHAHCCIIETCNQTKWCPQTKLIHYIFPCYCNLQIHIEQVLVSTSNLIRIIVGL